MKLNITIFAFLTFLFSMVLSCSSGDTNETGENNDTVFMKTDTVNQEHQIINTSDKKDSVSSEKIKNVIVATKYICPQGDKEGNSDKAGICPICEMELIENPDYNSNK